MMSDKEKRKDLKEKLERGEIPYFPHIEKFDEISVYRVDPPKPINKFFYDEVYKKGILPKKQLIVGKYYKGKCRNSDVARWDGEYFTYMRSKFNHWFPEKINHLDDDDGFDLFIPLHKTTPSEKQIIKIIDI